MREEQVHNHLLTDTHFKFIDMHDGKMAYCLTGHVMWNQKHHPYLLCKCMRGEAVMKNDTLFCEFSSNMEQIHFYNRSKRRSDRKRAEVGKNALINHTWIGVISTIMV